MPEAAPALRALLIGIDRYEPGAEPGAFRYPSLYGAVTDVRRVESYLTGMLDVSPERIEVLLSSHAGRGTEPPATAAEMVAALLRLEAACGAGDHALVFYSGHGGRAPTRLPEVKGADGIDEVLASMDVADPATPYLHDVEIAAWLARMAARGAFVTLVLDCCHSGGAPRNRRRFRGVDCVDGTRRPPSGLAADREELLRVWRPRAAVRSLSLVPTPARQPKGWASLAACRPHERALEDSIHGGDPSGLLTHFLLEALQRAEPGLTYRRLHSAICTRLHSFYPGQTPMVDGEADRVVFGREVLPVPVGVEVLAVEGFAGDTVELAAGRIHGVQRGARFAIVERSSSGPPSGAPDVQAEVLDAGQTASRARIVTSPSAGRPPRIGDRALLIDPGPLALRQTVAWSPLTVGSAGDATGGPAVLDRLLAESGSALLAVAAPGETHDFEVTVAGGTYRIRDRSGLPIRQLGPSLSTEDPASQAELVRRLLHLARYWSLRSLDNPVELGSLRGALRLELEPAGRNAEVPEGASVRLTVANSSAEPLNVAVLDLRPDWSIAQIFPGGAPFEVLEPGQPLHLDLDAHLPDGWAEGTDVLKVFAATEPFDLSSLELPPPAQEAVAATGRVRRAADCGGLAGLVDALAGSPSRRPAMRCAESAPDRWTTAQVDLRIVQVVEPPSAGGHCFTAARVG